MRNVFVVLAASLSLSVSAQTSFEKLNFDRDSGMKAIFTVSGTGKAVRTLRDIPYHEWRVNGSGKFFPMDVAPVLNGMVKGGIHAPRPTKLDPSQYKAQAAEFAQVVNYRNKDGRAALERKDKNADKLLTDTLATTYVVETLLSTVIDRPVSAMNLTQDKVEKMAASVDLDHYHFQIPGSFALNALEEEHMGFETIKEGRNYLLSVFDLRDYGCAVMKDGVRDYFSKNPDKEQLQNESIYVISQVDLNNANDLAQAERFFGKKPSAVISQTAVYADHLVRSAKTVFAFFSEGDKTRVVLLSNIAMGSKFFTGKTGALIRPYILDGVGTGVTGAVLASKDSIDSLISGATKDASQKNSCDRGMALGLKKYSESLFENFVNFAKK